MSFIFFAAQLSNAQSEKFKALFMYNFAKNIQWPANTQKSDFVIVVLGSSPMTDELKYIASKQKVGSQSIVVKSVSSAGDIGECQIVFIPTNQSNSLKATVESTSGKSILIVTEKEGSAKEGSCINYIQDGGRIKFELNKSNVEKRGMVLNSSLVTLGIPVN